MEWIKNWSFSPIISHWGEGIKKLLSTATEINCTNRQELTWNHLQSKFFLCEAAAIMLCWKWSSSSCKKLCNVAHSRDIERHIVNIEISSSSLCRYRIIRATHCSSVCTFCCCANGGQLDFFSLYIWCGFFPEGNSLQLPLKDNSSFCSKGVHTEYYYLKEL